MQTFENRNKTFLEKQLHISCIVPVHNEEKLIISFLQTLQTKLQDLSNNYEIILVDDGSTDNTFNEIKSFSLTNRAIKIIKLARNFGKENALTAGLENCRGDVAILMDADFQHPIETIPVFLQQWIDGYNMVYGIRENRDSESFFKRLFAKCFYQIMKISSVDIPPNAGDFRLLDKKVINALNAMPERNRFMKGLYAWVGFKTIAVPYKVAERAAGKSSWSFYQLVELAITGITSFSNIPLRIWSFIGLCISSIAFIYGAYIVLKTLIVGIDVPGFATIIVAIMFFGGIQLISIGILGEYLARIFTEVKQRPKYIVAEKIGLTD